MKKSTKLLSVILAIIMIFSTFSVGAFAAKASYQTVANLESLGAYSPYGAVTRLSTEERASIIMDSLDILLKEVNLNLGTLVDTMGLKIAVDARSINALLGSIDTVKSSTGALLWGVAKGLLGIIKNIEMSNWATGKTRENTAQETILNMILRLLSDNTTLINAVFTNGADIGLVKNFLHGIDWDAIDNILMGLPKAINAIVLPLFGRQDDTATERGVYGNTSSSLTSVAQTFVNGLFTKPMNWTSYRVDAAGNDLGYTMTLPMGSASGKSRYFVDNGDGTITQFDYKYAGILGGEAGWEETVTYTKTLEREGSTTYVYKAPDWYDGDGTLKWYKADGKVTEEGRIQSSYWSPVLKDAFENKGLTLNLTSANTSLLKAFYDFAPYVFAELAPVVLNGSAKKLIAGAFSVDFEKIGVKGDDAVAAVAAATGNPDSFFTRPQEYYVWEYSDYKVIDGVPYYRYQDEFFVGTMPSNLSKYYDMFNWDWNVTGDFFNEFIPTTVGSTWALDSLNNIVAKAINTLVNPEWSDVFAWEAGGNEKLLTNIMTVARNVVNVAPEELFGERFEDEQFYDAMMNGTLQQATKGLICELVGLLMKQIYFPTNIVDQPITAILAVVARELCTQLMPSYDFDAMIYADYNTRTLVTHTADEWLNISLYMGVNLGMYYLNNIADLGNDDNTRGYYAAMKNLGALPTTNYSGMTFTANSYMATDAPSWLVMVDWIVDWALTCDVEWGWHFQRLIYGVGESSDTIKADMTKYENPFTKISKILVTFIPQLETLLNLDAFAGTDYGSGSFLEKILKDGLVDNIVNLDVPSLLSMFKVKSTSLLRAGNVADTLVTTIRDILDAILYKVAGGANIIDKSKITGVSSLLNHDNLKSTIVTLVGKLYAANNTYHLLDTLLPLANLFIGWKMDPQVFEEPIIQFSMGWGDNYLNASSNDCQNFIEVTNKASGMLQKHRNASSDNAYKIKITGISASAGSVALGTTDADKTVDPGFTKTFKITAPSNDVVVKYTVAYEVYGKSGAKIGSTYTKALYAYVSHTDDVENVSGRQDGDDDKDYLGTDDFKRYVFTKDIYDTIVNYEVNLFGTGAITGQKDSNFQSMTSDKAPVGNGATYFRHITNINETKLPSKVTKGSSNFGEIYKAKTGVTAETNFPYGIYDMGQFAIKYKSTALFASGDSKVYPICFIYYNDYDIGELYNEHIGYGYQASDFSNATLWNAYENALKEVIKLHTYPRIVTGTIQNFSTNYFTNVQNNIPAAMEALQNAYDALMDADCRVTADASVQTVQNKLDTIETWRDDNGFKKDLNFQDHTLYEYFQYEKQRTNARNMIKSATAPEEPQRWIEDGVYGDTIVDAIVASKDGYVKQGIEATVIAKDMEDPEYLQKLADYKPAKYTDLAIDNQVDLLGWYSGLMNANAKTADKNFITKEIAYAQANFANNAANEALYSTSSWTRYTTALATAIAVNANGLAKESEVFDAKYELMVAMNELMLKSDSMMDDGADYLGSELRPLIEQANNVIDHFADYYAVKDGVDADDAWGELVRALGVEYDVTLANGEHHTGILYDRSALTYDQYDRPNTEKEKGKVDVACDNLKNALANFVCTVTVEQNNNDEVVNQVDQDVRFIQGIVPGVIKSATDLKAHIHASVPTAILTPAVSKAGAYGTGAKVDVSVEGIGVLTTYYVVIYGDVNGDGAIDAFDAFAVDKDFNTNNTYLDGIYATAADTSGDGQVSVADFQQIMSEAAGYDAVNQVK